MVDLEYALLCAIFKVCLTSVWWGQQSYSWFNVWIDYELESL